MITLKRTEFVHKTTLDTITVFSLGYGSKSSWIALGDALGNIQLIKEYSENGFKCFEVTPEVAKKRLGGE